MIGGDMVKKEASGALSRRASGFPVLPFLIALFCANSPTKSFAACGGIATAFCVSAFSSAETPPGVGVDPTAGFSFVGPGAFSVLLSDPISGKTGVSVIVTDGGEARVGAGGLVKATDGDGVVVVSTSGPAVASIGAGGVSATGVGVRAISNGAGNITVEGAGAIFAGGAGISAASSGGNVFVNESGPITGATGIMASTTGAAGLAILTRGAVTGTTGDGIVAYTRDGLNTLVLGPGGATGFVNGAVVGATGGGGVSINITGALTGATGVGLAAMTNSGDGRINIDNNVTVGGKGAAVLVMTQSGSMAFNSNGNIVALGDRAFVSSSGSGSVAFQNNGVLQGTIAATNLGGALSILNNASIDGAIVTASGGTTGVTNIGTWTRAGGSNISSFVNQGTFAMGPAGGEASTLAVAGNVTLGANTHWTARLTAAGVDRIAAGGVTTIEGGTLAIALTPGGYLLGRTYQIITSTGGIVGAFDHAYVTGGGGYFTSRFVGGSSGLGLALDYGSLLPIAVTANEKLVAKAFDDATKSAPGGAAGAFLSALYSQTGLAPLATLDQINGDAAGAAINANLAAGRMFSQAIGARQGVLRTESQTATTHGDGWYTGASRSNGATASSGGFGVWSAGFGGAGAFTADKDTGASAQTHTTLGAALGADYQIGAFSLGAVSGVSEGAFKAGGATGSARGLHAGLHAGLVVGDFYATLSASGARYTDDTSRKVAGFAGLGSGVESGHAEAREGRMRFEAGWSDASPGFHVAPFAAVEAAILKTDAYSESLGAGGGGAMGLSYAARTTPSVPASLGVRLNDNIVLPNGVAIAAKASIAWEYEFAPQRTTLASLAILPGTTLAFEGARPSGSTIHAQLGVEARITRAIALFASLDGEFSQNYKSIAGRGGASVKW
jgi:uncharacterized protein YhjY with autotransporter beta-barrel domain